MSWFSDFAKTALSEAQKRIDKVLDIEDESPTKTDSAYKLSDSSKFLRFPKCFFWIKVKFFFRI